jgi:hypothetical protein
MTVRELVRPPSRAFSLSTPRKLSRLEGSYVENTYTGGSANSESPVALRPSLARGLPLSSSYECEHCRSHTAVSTPRSNPCYLQPTCNRSATVWSKAFIDRSRDVKFHTPSVTSEDVPGSCRQTTDPGRDQQLSGNHIEPMNWLIKRSFDLDHGTPDMPR